MKREIEMPKGPFVSSGVEKPPRERRKLSLKFGAGDASNGVEAR